MISGESERADGDPREVLRDHDEFSEDDEIGVPAGLRAAERVDTSGPMRPNWLERSRHTGFEEDERPVDATGLRENFLRVARNLRGEKLGHRTAGAMDAAARQAFDARYSARSLAQDGR